MSWVTAHRIAHIAAVQTLHDLDVPPDQFPVPVADAIERAGVQLLWRPLDQLFGTYLRVGEVRGILVNERLTRSSRRHTAAHELGHHRLGHQLNPNSRCSVDTGEGYTPPRRWAPDEQVAEAFAAWFLMPPKAVRAGLASLRLGRPDGPASVYQLSLLLGTSYRATARHCVSLRLATRDEYQAWSSVSPGTLKQRLVAQRLESTQDLDVWSMGPFPSGQACCRYLSPGDLVVLRRQDLLDARGLSLIDNGPDHVVLVAPSRGKHLVEVVAVDGQMVELQLIIASRPHGLHLAATDARQRREREVNA